MQFCTFFFPLWVYFKLFTRQNMKTSCLTAVAQYLFNELSEGDVGCFQASVTAVKAAMRSLVGWLFAHLSGTRVLGLGAGIYHWLLPFPVTASSVPFPTSVSSDSLLGFSLANLCPGESDHYIKYFHLSLAFFPMRSRFLVPRTPNTDCKIISLLGGEDPLSFIGYSKRSRNAQVEEAGEQRYRR